VSEDQGKVGLIVDGGPDAEALVVAAGPRKEVEALRRWRESRHARALIASELVLRRWPGLTVSTGPAEGPRRVSEGSVAKARPSVQPFDRLT
jgi:hypothetical protein